jgi:hypothetical protein
MKNLVLAVIGICISVGANAATTCSNADLQGEWVVTYIFSKPAQVGECTIAVDNNLRPTGNCENRTFYSSSEVFDGNLTIAKNCVVKGTAYSTDGESMALNLKANPNNQTMSGVITSKIGKFTVKGTAKFTKTGDLSCSVISK